MYMHKQSWCCRAQEIKSSTKERLLGVLVDSESSFDDNISRTCTQLSSKLNALGPITKFM